MEIVLTCAECGTKFKTSNINKKYCSDACRNRYHYQKHKTEVHEYYKKYYVKHKEEIKSRSLAYYHQQKEGSVV